MTELPLGLRHALEASEGPRLGTSIGLLVRSSFLRIKGLGTLAQFISLYRQEGNPREQPLKNKGEYTDRL